MRPEKLTIYARLGWAHSADADPIKYRTGSQTERKQAPALGRNSLIPPPTSHVAFCVWPICPLIHSTGLAGMKQPCGGKPARSCLLSMHWIVANHKREGAVSVSVVGSRPMDATTTELPDRPVYAIDAKLGRNNSDAVALDGLRGLFMVALCALQGAPLCRQVGQILCTLDAFEGTQSNRNSMESPGEILLTRRTTCTVN